MQNWRRLKREQMDLSSSDPLQLICSPPSTPCLREAQHDISQSGCDTPWKIVATICKDAELQSAYSAWDRRPNRRFGRPLPGPAIRVMDERAACARPRSILMFRSVVL